VKADGHRIERRGNTTTVYDASGTVLQKWRDTGTGEKPNTKPKHRRTPQSELALMAHTLNGAMAYDTQVTLTFHGDAPALTGHIVEGRADVPLEQGKAGSSLRYRCDDTWFHLNDVSAIT
jgi:hypothetical protein